MDPVPFCLIWGPTTHKKANLIRPQICPAHGEHLTFYGDPAWQARPAVRNLPWNQEVSVKDNRYTFTVAVRQDGKWPGKPLVHLLPERVKNMKVVEGADRSPVVTSSFILLPLKGDFKSGDKVQIVLEAEPLRLSRLP